MADTKTPEELEAERLEAERLALEPLTAKDEEIAKLREERDNYKTVALKRLGKLPGDADFVASADEKTGLTIEESVRKVLLEKELSDAETAKNNLIKDQAKKISELTLALKNRPGASLGGGAGDTLEVKDNVLSEDQIKVLRAKAERLKVKDVDAFIAKAKQNIIQNSR